VRYDAVQALTEAQAAQARQNIYAAPIDALAYNGIQVNGDFSVSQERAFGQISTSGYVCDGWYFSKAGTMVPQSYVIPSGAQGLTNQGILAVTTAQASFTSTEFTLFMQTIEGYRMARLGWGTPSAQPVTMAFWTQHARPGLYSGSFRNKDSSRSCVFSYTQSAANVLQYQTVTIPGCTDGVWKTDNDRGIDISFAMACGPTYTAPVVNTWLPNVYLAAPGQVNAVASTSDLFRLSGVLILPGNSAPPAARASLLSRSYDQELLLCQRYWEQLTIPIFGGPANGVGIPLYISQYFTTKRAIPTVTLKTAPGLNGCTYNFGAQITPNYARFDLSPTTATGSVYAQNGVWNLDARM
jgi:hypothetical protein